MNKPRRTVIALLSDTHCGGSAGLMPPRVWKLAEGGEHTPNALQELIWLQWEECWERVGKLREGSRLIVVHAGDAVDGLHHNTTELVSLRPDEHQRIHVACMRWSFDTAGFDPDSGDLLYYVSGTPVHTSPGSASEEVIARELGARARIVGTPEMDYCDGSYTWDQLKIDINGVKFDIAHQGPVAGSRNWLKGNVFYNVLLSNYLDCIERGDSYPRYYIRAHRHTYLHRQLDRDGRIVDGFLLPCFCGKTDYVYKVMVDAMVNIGMVIVVVEEDGRTWYETPKLTIVEDEYQEIL